MHPKRALKIISIIFGLVFVLSILTVESHAGEKGSLAKLPTIIDGTIEFAVTISGKVELDVFRAMEYLPLSFGMLPPSRVAAPPQIYRGPPLPTL